MPFVGVFFGALARFLLSGLIAQIAVKMILYVAILTAIFQFYKNFGATSLDYALSFFNFFGFGDVISQIQYYYNQLPVSLRDTLSYFELGAMVGFLANNYASTIFLAWIMRRFG
jgi:hypothetical protein